MKQSDIISAPIGTGAAIIRECSNDTAKIKIPQLTLMLPMWQHPDTGHISPAVSIELQAAQITALHQFLTRYFSE